MSDFNPLNIAVAPHFLGSQASAGRDRLIPPLKRRFRSRLRVAAVPVRHNSGDWRNTWVWPLRLAGSLTRLQHAEPAGCRGAGQTT